MHKKIHVKTKNKICAAVLVFVLAGSLTAGACAVPNVYAKTEAEKKRDAYKKKLKAKNSDIANIKDSQSDVKDSITAAAARMKTLLSKQEQLKSDIKDKQNEVEQANKKLEEAKEEEQNQYDAMKLRIQYLYENSTDNSIWSAILESNGLSDMLNRIEYATDLYKSDRELMTSYQNAVKKVEDWTMQLADEMDSLLALQDKYQTQQGELKTLMAKLEQQKDAYAQQLAEAQKQAQDYKKTISKQEAIIRAQEAAAARANANTYDGGGTGASGGIASDSYLKDPDCNPSQTTDVSGADIVAFAQQFVGNPYVWGGNSLTNGVDCSGFVHQVYAHFGISTPRYSQAFKRNGGAKSLELLEQGKIPEKELRKYSSFWFKDFDGMALKTMLRQLISKWGIMSIDLQTALDKDMAVIHEDGTTDYVDTQPEQDNVVADQELQEVKENKKEQPAGSIEEEFFQ